VQAWELLGEGPDDVSALSSMEGVREISEGWDIQCSQLCGNNHFKMGGVLLPMTQKGFDAWLEEAHKETPAGMQAAVTPAPTGTATAAAATPTPTPAKTPAATASPETH
jgi:hypothetical protein